MMITKIGKALAVIGALALLAMPAHALAQEGESHHEKQPNPEDRPEKKQNQDRGRHLGWNKQQKDGGRDDNEWYQGQRGRWNQEGNRWQWKGAEGDQWYQGQRGHWYQEGNRWQWRGDGGQSSAQWQRRQALVNQDRMARARYREALARGDKKAAAHWLKQLNSTDKQLGMTQQQINAGVLPY